MLKPTSSTSTLRPLKIRCTASDCESGLHCFRATKKLRIANQVGRCRSCGADLIDWGRVKRLDLRDAASTFASLQKELVRHHFWHVSIDDKAVNYARRKGRPALLVAARKRIERSVGGEQPYRDGRQTPQEGNPIYYAQHATASCCRKCMEEWHGIPAGRALTEREIGYFTGLAMMYLEERLKLADEPERVPHIKRRIT
jgi:hypothetical protein